MSGERVGTAKHNVHVAAPAGVVYALAADTSNWPLYISPTVHVERLEFDGERERVRMWNLLSGQLKSWTSWRHLDPVERRIEFRQELPTAPLESLGGVLSVREEGPHSSVLELEYDFTVAGDVPDDVEWAEEATAGLGRTQLAELKILAERWSRLDELMLSFEDSIRIHGPAELAYDFLYRAGDWPELMPHVTRAHVTEDTPGVQRVAMETLTEYGSQSTEAERICFPHAGRIIYKHTTSLALLAAHTGEWSVVPDETGVTVTARQNVVLRAENVTAALGSESAGFARARRYVRERLGQEAQATLALAKQHAESLVRML
jgi:uncharacterized membrane protein